MIGDIISAIGGFILGLIFYSKVLDKPETVNHIKKQKARKGGLFKNIFKSKN